MKYRDSHHRFAAAFSAAVTVLAAETFTHAQPAAGDRAAATELFREGRRLMEEKRFSEACRKLEESQRLDPGGGTLLNLALCHEAEGKTATAWSELNEALSLARRDGRDERVKLAQDKIAAIEPTLSRLVVRVGAAADRPELEVKRDGSQLRRAAWGTAIPVDPGEHLIEASAPGYATWSNRVKVAAGAATESVEVPPLVVLAPQPLPHTSAILPPPTTPSASPPPPAPVEKPKTVGYAFTAVGAAGIVVGGIFGLRALSKHQASNDACPSANSCRGDGAMLEDSARAAADVSTVAFTIGLVSAGIGAYLLVSSNAVVAPAAGKDGGGVSVRGHF